nr:MAG TPA: major capsid protein [Caudoviricetes sp.]
MYIDKQNTFFYKQAVIANVNSDVVMNGNGGDAETSLWLVIRLDKDVTGTPLFNLYTSNAENIANAVLLHGITLPANSKAGTKVAVRLGSGAKKYLKLNANNMTGGTITAFLTPDVRLV